MVKKIVHIEEDNFLIVNLTLVGNEVKNNRKTTKKM